MTRSTDDWLDVGQVAALLGVPRPRVDQMIDERTLPIGVAPSGAPGLRKSDFLAWQRHDRAQRRAGLVALAAAVDREIFG